MTTTRYKHIITTTTTGEDGQTTTDAKVFPSINQAKRYNRTKLGGVAKVVTRRPKNGNIHDQNNAFCKKED